MKLLTDCRAYASVEPVNWQPRRHWYRESGTYVSALRAVRHLEFLREQVLELSDPESERGKGVPAVLRSRLHAKILPISKRFAELLIGPNLDLQKQWRAEVDSHVWWTNDWNLAKSDSHDEEERISATTLTACGWMKAASPASHHTQRNTVPISCTLPRSCSCCGRSSASTLRATAGGGAIALATCPRCQAALWSDEHPAMEVR
jgi:hypothetical protein